MDTPSRRSRLGAKVIKVMEELGAFAVFAAVLDTLGGGPEIFTIPMVLGAAALFATGRVLLTAITAYWMAAYIGGISGTDAALGVGFATGQLVAIAGLSVAWFTVAMGDGLTSITLIATAAVIAAKIATEYEFSINDSPVVSG